MKVRHGVEVILTLIITILFQYLMMNCISSMHKAVQDGEYLGTLDSLYSTNFIPEYVALKKKIISDIKNDL
jgi:hypothetical protein